jgi:hypothetical protein
MRRAMAAGEKMVVRGEEGLESDANEGNAGARKFFVGE